MQRSLAPEIMDNPGVTEDAWEDVHRQLGLLHRFLGNYRAILRALRCHPERLRRVLDIGCGQGDLLDEIRRRLAVDVVGVELRAPKRDRFRVPIVEADAASDRLPRADVAVCVLVTHHLSEGEIVAFIQNARRSVQRLIILDLVRHWLPMFLFTAFVTPLVSREFGADGRQSIRRSYTLREMRTIVQRALAGSCARVEHSVTAMRSRQMVDIQWI